MKRLKWIKPILFSVFVLITRYSLAFTESDSTANVQFAPDSTMNLTLVAEVLGKGILPGSVGLEAQLDKIFSLGIGFGPILYTNQSRTLFAVPFYLHAHTPHEKHRLFGEMGNITHLVIGEENRSYVTRDSEFFEWLFVDIGYEYRNNRLLVRAALYIHMGYYLETGFFPFLGIGIGYRL